MKNYNIQSCYFWKFFVLTFALTFSTFYGCQTRNPENSNLISIEGNIKYPSGNKILLFTYLDSVSLFQEKKTPVDTSIIDKNGNFSFKIQTNNPIIFNLENGKNTLATNLFLCKGDKLVINFTDKENTPLIPVSKTEGKFNSYLLKFIDRFYKDPKTKQEYYIATNYMDGALFTKYNKKRENDQLGFFESYFKNDSLKKEYRDYAINNIVYGIAVDRLMYLRKKRIKNETVSVDSAFLDFSEPSTIENKDALNCPAYIHFLNLYINDIYERMVEMGELPLSKSESLKPSVEKYKLAKKLLNRPYSDAVLYNIILSDINDLAKSENTPPSQKTSLDSMISWFEKKYSLN